MENLDFLALIAGGESSVVQFKENVTNAHSIAEEMPVRQSKYADIDWDKFKEFYEKRSMGEEPIKERTGQYLESLRLGNEGRLNVAGALLFGENNANLIPSFYIAAVWFPGNEKFDNSYRSSLNIVGTLRAQYEQAFDFIKTKINYVQGEQGFNSVGIPEVPFIVLQELLVNALVHRDYFIQDSIKVFVFQNRIEIVNPGKLPNNLTVEQMKRGLRKQRNAIIGSFGLELLPYKAIGSGVMRALDAYPDIEFVNDVEAEQFTAIIHRKP